MNQAFRSPGFRLVSDSIVTSIGSLVGSLDDNFCRVIRPRNGGRPGPSGTRQPAPIVADDSGASGRIPCACCAATENELAGPAGSGRQDRSVAARRGWPGTRSDGFHTPTYATVT